MKFYRIRNAAGQYAAGGMERAAGYGSSGGRFSKNGKVWLGLGPFVNHLAQYSDPLKYYKECVLIVIDEEAKTFTEIEFDIWYAEYKLEKAKKR